MTAFEDGAACPNKSLLYAYLVGKGLIVFHFQKGFQHVPKSWDFRPRKVQIQHPISGPISSVDTARRVGRVAAASVQKLRRYGGLALQGCRIEVVDFQPNQW
jgi:ABC-type branched-subunit amino acid transport system substrate-binding protein